MYKNVLIGTKKINSNLNGLLSVPIHNAITKVFIRIIGKWIFIYNNAGMMFKRQGMSATVYLR